MTAPQLFAAEAEAGQPKNALYMRGRSAVLGDPPPVVVAELFGVFQTRLVEVLLSRGSLAADAAVAAYSAGLWQWSRDELAAAAEPGALADLLLKVVDAADACALPLFAGWRAAPRPDGDVERLGHALMLMRELRGALHFAALRTNGVRIAFAVLADPEGGPTRLRRLGWRDEDIEALQSEAASISDLADRWKAAEAATDRLAEETLSVLSPDELVDLTARLTALSAAAPAQLGV